MSSETPSPASADVAWPKQSWFLRGPLLSTVMVIISIGALVTEFSVMALGGETAIGFVGLLLSALGLLVIFRARWVGLALMTVGAGVNMLFASEYIGIWTVTVFGMFLFARQGRHVLPTATAVAAFLYFVLSAREDGQVDSPIALIAATSCLAAAAAGSVVRLQTESWDAARHRAADLAAAQAVELRQAVNDERLRIARDLHDVVGHELAVVNINVGVAEVSLPSEADDARRALQSAREGLQRTLHETQQILDLLRATDAESDQRTELPRVEHIPSLVDRVNTTGVQVEASIEDDLPALDADVSAAAYRIVQEALTNAERHGVAPVRLTIGSTGASLVIDVVNQVAAAAATESSARAGYGLVGMRERTQSAGGTIEIARTEHEFGVHVELPTKASER
ncbi:sensor histidine kinase [Agromyces sp. NPDC058484]|uniref:sensor histidine kinase n=1 Tax=Agromyces sp. NPDC058484 TaxID=3346524 RepID=UPI0036499B87